MEKITLALNEILQLESEINGYVNPESGDVIYKGFLKANLPIILKYELVELSETLTKERKKIETLRDELIKKYGEEEQNGVSIRMINETKDEEGAITKVINPRYVEFTNEYSELLTQEKEIEFPEINKESLKKAGDTTDNYKVLFKLVKS